MYYKNTIEEVKAELSKRAAFYAGAAKAWEAVEIAKKKNGEEFADIRRALRGCEVSASLGLGYPRVAVRFSVGSNYWPRECDEIDLFGYCDELPDGDPRKNKVGPAYCRAIYTKTADEIREAVAARVVFCKEHAEALREQAELAEEAVKEFRDAVEAAEAKLLTYGRSLCKYSKTSLFYLATATR